jgi:transcriptional regulator with XRE-family HTH domain
MHRGYNWGMRGLETLGERVTALRKPAGYRTQRALAVRLDVSDAFLSDIVRGVKNPSLEMLCELAGLLRTTTDYLLLRTDDPDVPGVRPLENGDPVYFSPEADEVARIIDALPPETRQYVLYMVRAMSTYMAGRISELPGPVESDAIAPGTGGKWFYSVGRVPESTA